jgi:N-methylhydantoinase A
LITTAGFRDVYEIARHNRLETYDLAYKKPVPLVPRRRRLEIRERLGYDGSIIEPLVEEDVVRCVSELKQADVTAIAVCLLHAYANPQHEIRVGEIIAAEYPEAMVSLSHELTRQWREYERTSTTAINSYVMPIVGSYLDDMDSAVREQGFEGSLLVSQSAGGVIGIDVAKRKPVRTMMSGPAGGATAARHFRSSFDTADLIAFDVGGTSADVSLMLDGSLRVTVEGEVDRHPIIVPMIEIKSIGAGGGSIASVDERGALGVGPRSAGAVPGPICYGLGGAAPTVTDAFAVVGSLDPKRFLGGQMELDVDAAREGIAEQIAAPLGLSPTEAALGIIEILDTKMAYAVRAVTVERGLDPRGFTLLAYGGAGPLSACSVAGRIGIRDVIVPTNPGNFSALGMVVSDLRHDFVRTVLVPSGSADTLPRLNNGLKELVAEADSVLISERVAADERTLDAAVDLRYAGQEYTITVPIDETTLDTEALDEAIAAFHLEHGRRYGHSAAEDPTEVVNVRLTAVAAAPEFELPLIRAGDIAPPPEAQSSEVEMSLRDGSTLVAPVYEREALLAGNRLSGPALIVEKGATTLLIDPFTLEVTPHGHLRMTVGA